MSGAARLALHDLACLRGGRLLFEGLDLQLGGGEAALLTGPNGAGKSSLIRIVAGLLAPAAGRIEQLGGIAFAGETAALDPTRTLGAALAFWARLDGGDVMRGLEAMEISALAEVPVRMLSTGQRKRAALARVIAGRAAIWLLDEPGNGLDGASLERLAAAMAAHRAAGGIVVAATHQPLGLGDARQVTL